MLVHLLKPLLSSAIDVMSTGSPQQCKTQRIRRFWKRDIRTSAPCNHTLEKKRFLPGHLLEVLYHLLVQKCVAFDGQEIGQKIQHKARVCG